VATRGRIRLDPSGFSRSVEEGFDDQYNGQRLAKLFARDPKKPGAGFVGGLPFWNPGGGPILLPFPRQFSPTWYADTRLQYHTLKSNLWTFAANTHVLTFVPPSWDPSGATFPDYQWISIYSPASTVSLDSTSYTALAAAAGLTLPAGMKTVAVCGQTPIGTPLGAQGFAHFTPFLQAAVYPPPSNAFVFGWSNLAIVMSGEGGVLVRSPSGDKTHWEKLAKFRNIPSSAQALATQFHADHYGASDEVIRAQVRSMFVAEYSEDSLWFDFFPGSAAAVRWRDSPGVGVPGDEMPSGAWWVAAATDQRADFHAEVAGFEHTETSGNRPVIFDFGTLAPTQQPDVEPVFVMHSPPGGTFTTTTGGSGTTVTSPYAEHVTYALIHQETGDLWVSDGVKAKGSFFLALHPNNPGGTNAGYLALPFKLLKVSFPPLITPRLNDESIIEDTDYDAWATEGSYYDPEHGQIKVVLREGADSTFLENSNYQERFGFPILYEETDTAGPPSWSLKWLAWVESIELADEETLEQLGVPGLRHYMIKAKPILDRADVKWINGFRLVNPSGVNGIPHEYAIARVLASAHFDTSNPAEVAILPDPWHGTARGMLPGTWNTYVGVSSNHKDDPWGPSWSETKLKYLKRIAHDWAGWVFYTSLKGKVRYHPDLLSSLDAREAFYYATFEFYQKQATAVAAGAPKEQIYTKTSQTVIPPRGNVIVIHGKDDDDQPAKVVKRDVRAVTDPTYANFSGEENPSVLVSRSAVGTKELGQLAEMKLRRDRRKRVIRKFQIDDLPPWLFYTPIGGELFDVGTCFVAEGRGTFVCIHLSVELKHRGVYRTVITGERVPVGSIGGLAVGPYPGSGLPF
jgi:hypothetical protein